jgi:hypothetical protein
VQDEKQGLRVASRGPSSGRGSSITSTLAISVQLLSGSIMAVRRITALIQILIQRQDNVVLKAPRFTQCGRCNGLEQAVILSIACCTGGGHSLFGAAVSKLPERLPRPCMICWDLALGDLVTDPLAAALVGAFEKFGLPKLPVLSEETAVQACPT